MLLFSAGLALLSVALAGRQEIEVGPVEAEARVVPFYHGETVLILPPLGEISALTHKAPLRLEVTLRNLDFPALEAAADGWNSSHQVIAELEPEARAALFLLLRRVFLVAAAGGALGGFGLARRGRGLAVGALTGLVVTSALVVPAYLTYDLQAFGRPRYRGALEAAPWMISLAQRSLRQVDDLGKQLRLLGNNLTDLFERANRLGMLGAVPGDVQILHVSDIHNNPAALQLVAQVVQNFGVDAVIDTGDLTDFGTALEAELPKKIRDLRVPYFLVAGNHDAPHVLARLQRYPNVRVLNGEPQFFRGLTILGFPDPASTTNDPAIPSPALYRQLAQDIEATLQKIPKPIDILALHSSAAAPSSLEGILLLLYGHDHRLSIVKKGETVWSDAGTTGAAGVRGLNKKAPYSLVLLYFERRSEPDEMGRLYRVVAADTIQVDNLMVGFRLERILFPAEVSPSEGAASPLEE